MHFSKYQQYPKVSIVIPVYNGSNYMSEAIDSALAQTYKNIEVLVINDGSNDNGKTREIALSYGNKIRYFEKLNGGVATALNLGIREMRGEYFSWLSHDDVYYPDKVEKQINYLKNEKNKNVIMYSDFDFINNLSEFIRTVKIKNTNTINISYALLTDHPIHGCTVLIPKMCFDIIGLFNEDLKTTQDYDMWFRMSRVFCFIHIPEPLIKSRTHDGQSSRTIKIHATEIDEYYVKCLERLSEDELSAISGNKSSLIEYLRLAIGFKSKNYKFASRVAFCLGEKRVFKGSIKSFFKGCSLLVYYYLISLFVLFKRNLKRFIKSS